MNALKNRPLTPYYQRLWKNISRLYSHLSKELKRFASRIKQKLLSLLSWAFLHRWAPRGLYWRTILIILLPIALMQMVITYAFFDGHWNQTSKKLSEGVAGDIAFLLELYDHSPHQFDAFVETARLTTGLSATIRPDAQLPIQNPPTIFSKPMDQALSQKLSGVLKTPFWFDTTAYPEFVDIQVELPDGQGVMRALVFRDRVHVTGAHLFVLWMGGVTVALAFVAVAFIRYQIRPIEHLAYAADAFGRGLDMPDFKPRGASEVRIAAQSVIRMRDRIRRFAEQRTSMLAAVSHDLRTPLTRLRLELAMLENVDMKAANSDISQMEKMLEGYLAFARGDSDEEEAEMLDLKLMLEEIARSLGNSDKVKVDIPMSVQMRLRPISIQRAVSNLVNNALHHAEKVRISLEISKIEVKIMVDDDGPGIPRKMRNEVFRPFTRLDPARNQNVSGVGLGLAAARDAARAHGGDVVLSDSPLGGLRAILGLPRRGERRKKTAPGRKNRALISR